MRRRRGGGPSGLTLTYHFGITGLRVVSRAVATPLDGKLLWPFFINSEKQRLPSVPVLPKLAPVLYFSMRVSPSPHRARCQPEIFPKVASCQLVLPGSRHEIIHTDQPWFHFLLHTAPLPVVHASVHDWAERKIIVSLDVLMGRRAGGWAGGIREGRSLRGSAPCQMLQSK